MCDENRKTEEDSKKKKKNKVIAQKLSEKKKTVWEAGVSTQPHFTDTSENFPEYQLLV